MKVVGTVTNCQKSWTDQPTDGPMEQLTKWIVEAHPGAEWNTVVLQGHCFDSRLVPFYLESNTAKFQLDPLWNG